MGWQYSKDEYKQKKIEVRKLRKEGWSIRRIVAETGISKSTVSRWCSDITLTDDQKRDLFGSVERYDRQVSYTALDEDDAREQRCAYQQAGREKAQEGRPLHEMGCMLYWAEGAKERHRLHFANSDEHMLRLFMRFLREELHVSDDKLRLAIVCHATDADEIARIEAYWLTMFALTREHLHITQTKSGGTRSYNRLSNGVCAIIVQSTEYLQHVYGAIGAYGDFSTEDWL